jgi:hypothetical protein
MQMLKVTKVPENAIYVYKEGRCKAIKDECCKLRAPTNTNLLKNSWLDNEITKLDSVRRRTSGAGSWHFSSELHLNPT